MNAENDIVIAYDGSDNARRAITVAAGQIGPRHADVVHVWEPLASASSRLAIYAPMGGATAQELEAEAERIAPFRGAETGSLELLSRVGAS